MASVATKATKLAHIVPATSSTFIQSPRIRRKSRICTMPEFSLAAARFQGSQAI